MSHVFVDDSQDNMNLNDLVPHNDTEYNFQPEEEQVAVQVHQQPPALSDKLISNQFLPHSRSSPIRDSDKRPPGLDLPSRPADNGAFQAIE